MSKSDPVNASLPSTRLDLYEAVLLAGWPSGSDEVIREQQDRAAAAAWRMVSEREPHEDKRRLRPDVDLAHDLLVALADAPDREGRPVRLLRRIGELYEFVHDQMHVYLAARWFTQPDLTLSELETMVSASTIWSHAIPERRMLWGFVAALLDDGRLLELLVHVEDNEKWDVLRRELKAEAVVRKLKG